jgi:hypothetical protein
VRSSGSQAETARQTRVGVEVSRSLGQAWPAVFGAALTDLRWLLGVRVFPPQHLLALNLAATLIVAGLTTRKRSLASRGRCRSRRG